MHIAGKLVAEQPCRPGRWDAIHRSVCLRCARNAEVVVDLYREGATLRTVGDHETGPVVVLEYHAGDCGGRTRVQTRPTLSLKGTFLRS